MKILLQKLWLAGLSWDEPLPDAMQNEWTEFKSQLPSFETISINRWIQTTSKSTLELHGFSDASEKAYAAAIYARVQVENDKWSVHLIATKTRVAPVKQVSLPRLELCGSVLLAKLLKSVQWIVHALSIHAWSDSEIVLAWLQGHPSRWTTFVANRVSSIHDYIDAASWQHISSKDNPSDCASRGLLPNQLVKHPLWWHGPDWLSNPDSSWPRRPKYKIPCTQLEMKRTQSFVTIPINNTLDKVLHDCSSISKVNRVIAYMFRWHNKNYKSSNHNIITSDELAISIKLVIRHSQQLHFYQEYTELIIKQNLQKTSKLLSLHPFLDEDNIIRVGVWADLPFSTRHPIIIPRKSRLTELLIYEAHNQTMHGSVSLMLSHIRTQCWIIDGPRSHT